MLYSPCVWLEAATQISLSTYTTEKIKAMRLSVFVNVVNAFTSLVVAIVVYSVLGFQTTQEGADLQEVGRAEEGRGRGKEKGLSTISMKTGQVGRGGRLGQRSTKHGGCTSLVA